MKTANIFPTWPSPEDEPIGAERVRVYMAWIHDRIGPVLKGAERIITARNPGMELSQWIVTVEDLASASRLYPKGWDAEPIAAVWCSFTLLGQKMVDRADIYLDKRTGQLLILRLPLSHSKEDWAEARYGGPTVTPRAWWTLF